MRISSALKTRISRLSNRISNDRGNIGLTVMMGTVLMMLAMYTAVKALGPALHTISGRSDIRRAGTLSNLANSYIAQTGDMQPTIAKLVTAGLLPSGAKGVCSTCAGVGTYTTNDGSVLSMVPGSSSGIFGMTLLPGPNMAQDMNYYLSHLTGSIQNGRTVAWNQPVPAIVNLGSRFVQTNPANPGATQTVTSPLSTGAISTGTNPINSGSVNTGNVNSNSLNLGNGRTLSYWPVGCFSGNYADNNSVGPGTWHFNFTCNYGGTGAVYTNPVIMSSNGSGYSIQWQGGWGWYAVGSTLQAGAGISNSCAIWYTEVGNQGGCWGSTNTENQVILQF